MLHYVVHFKWELLRKHGDGTWTEHDDILLCQAIQRSTGWPSYLTPNGSMGTSLRMLDLSSNDAYSARANHIEIRSRLIRMSGGVGWRSLWQSAETVASQVKRTAQEALNG
jgi:hypothetical protein